MFGYATTLRSVTQGRGVYTMEFFMYSECPKQVYENIVIRKRKEVKWQKKNLKEKNHMLI